MEQSARKNTNTKSNFGKIGWLYILFSLVALMFMTSLTTDTLNVTIAKFSQERQWSQDVLLSISTYSGWVSIAGTVLVGWLLHRLGSRMVLTLTFVVGGLSYIWWGYAGSLWQYAVAACVFSVCANAFGLMACSNLLSYWFPTKKGLALGWATMGNNLSPVIIVPIMSWLLANTGLERSFLTFGIAMVVLAVISWLAVRNTPEELGCFPDNDPDYTAGHADEREKSGMPVSQILLNRNTWLAGLGYGLLYLVTVGLMSQFIPRLISQGIPEEKATFMFAVVALIGVVGSYLWGWLDQRLGTKPASILFAVWFGLAVLFNVLPGQVCLYISLVMIGCAIGGTTNLSASLVGTIFGRFDFAKAFTVVNPIMSVVRVCAFSVLALALNVTGSLTGAYLCFIVLCAVSAVMFAFVKERRD